MPRKTMRGGVHPSKKVASTDVVELYGNALCPCSNAVRLCLYEKHVAFKFHGVRLVVPDGDFGNLRRAYLRVNPGGIVPTLVHEGRPVYESRRCLDYVDEVMPGKSLVPRAVAEAVGAWCDRCAVEGHGDFSPASATRSLGSCAMTLGAPLEAALAQDVGANALRRGLFQGRRRWPLLLLSLKRWGPNFVAKMPHLMMALKTALEQARRHLDVLETDLGDGRPWACGPDYTLADVSLTATLDRLVVADWGSLVDRRPKVAAYWRRLRDRPSYAACLGSQRPLALEVGMSRLRDWKRTDPGFAAVLDLGAGRAAPGRSVAPELNLRRASAPAQRRSIFSSVASTAKEGFRRASLAVAPAPPVAPAAPPPDDGRGDEPDGAAADASPPPDGVPLRTHLLLKALLCPDSPPPSPKAGADSRIHEESNTRARRSIAALDDDDRAAAFPTGTPRALKALLAPDHATPAASPDKHRDDEGGDSEATPRYDDGEADRRPAEPSWRGPGLLLHSPPKPRGSAVLAPIVP